MNKNDLISYYYNTLKKYINYVCSIDRRVNFTVKSLSYNNHSLKELLGKIIDNNNQYLLTDDYLLEMILNSIYGGDIYDCRNFRKDLYQNLHILVSNDKKEIIKGLIKYYERLNYDGRLIYPEVLKTREGLMNNSRKYLLESFKDSIHRVDGPEFKYHEWDLLYYIFLTVLAICIVNNDMDNYQAYCDYIIDNRYKYLESFRMNNLFHDEEIHIWAHSNLNIKVDDVIDYFLNRPIKINKEKVIK